MSQFLLVRPGATDYDEQRRIMGRLDIPLNETGANEVARTVQELADFPLQVIYSAPCESALQTASAIAKVTGARVKEIEALQNLDAGLWQGKLMEELRCQQPKVYRMWQDRPDSICPPEGEMLEAARSRTLAALQKIMRKHKQDSIVACVIPEPLASVVFSVLTGSELGDLWQAECSGSRWELIDVSVSNSKAG